MGTAGQSITLANSIIGVGILAMPFCFQQCGALLAVMMLLLSGLVSRLACYFLLKSAIIARKRNFEFLAFHVFGASGKLMVEIAIIGFLMGTCIAYFVVVGDLGPQIISKMFNINQSNFLRTCVMFLVSVLCVLPLGLLRNVDSLSNVSAATIGFYFCLIFKIMAEAASQLLTSDWSSKIELWKPEGILQCVPIFSMALFCQTQLFEIFETMPSISLEKMNVVTKNAINMCTLVYLMVGVFGYIAFCGQHISGNILVSLSDTMASDVIKLGFVMSLAFSFPLIIFPCRASLYSLMYRKIVPSHHDHIINHSIPESTFRCITVGIIAISLFISLLIPNIELVLGLVGSTIGVMICVVFPSSVFVNLTVKNTNERLLAKIILCLGLIIMVLGTYANLQAADSGKERYDDKYITPEKIDKIVQQFLETNNKHIQFEEKLANVNLQEKNHKEVKENKIEDSAAQPPNPVAPEQENTQKPEQQNPSISKFVKKENFENEIEGAGDKENVMNGQLKNEVENNIDLAKKVIDNKLVEKVVADTAINQDKLKLLKEQQLMETIIQHGEEQKELLKEQIEILDKLEKTKKELKEKKLEDVQKEVNKIAVESIQEIAKIAIEKLSNVESNKVKTENLNVVENVKKDIENAIPKLIKDERVDLNKIDSKNEEVPRNKETYLNELNEGKSNKIYSKNEDILRNEKEKYLNELNEKIKKKSDEAKQKKSIKDTGSVPSGHIHTIDEPKSYMIGEDSEKNKSYVFEQKLSPSKKEALLNNVPVPLVMSQNFESEAVKPEIHEKLNKNNNMVEAINLREKREVENCKDREFQSDKEKCPNTDKIAFSTNDIDLRIPERLSVPDDVKFEKTHIDGQNNIIDILHQSRKLKSFNETKQR